MDCPSQYIPVLLLTRAWCTRSRPANARLRRTSRCDLQDSQPIATIYRSNSALPYQRTHWKMERNLHPTTESISTSGSCKRIPLSPKLQIVNLFAGHRSSQQNQPRLFGKANGSVLKVDFKLEHRLPLANVTSEFADC